jgi:hypothetical protein
MAWLLLELAKIDGENNLVEGIKKLSERLIRKELKITWTI